MGCSHMDIHSSANSQNENYNNDDNDDMCKPVLKLNNDMNNDNDNSNDEDRDERVYKKKRNRTKKKSTLSHKRNQNRIATDVPSYINDRYGYNQPRHHYTEFTIKNDSVLMHSGTMATNHNKKSFSNKIANSNTIRKSECNGVVIVETMNECVFKDITREMIYQMVEKGLEGCIIANDKQPERGKTVTRKQYETIAEIVYNQIQEGVKTKNPKRKVDLKDIDYSCIENINVKVRIRKLTAELIRETCFKGKNVTQMQIENEMNNISQGQPNINIMTIELS